MNKRQGIRALRLSAGSMSPGLYVHTPFCASKCRYCDFNSYAGLGWLFARYVSGLKQELARWPGAIGGSKRRPRLGTVYFGGGTPTLVGARHLLSVLDAARLSFLISPDAEITVETNPGVADPKDLDALVAAGVNRLSMGVQSFDDAELRLLGRIHTSAQVRHTWLAARRSGFKNVSLDLIYGLPGQTVGMWRRNLDRALELDPEHISLYALTIEEGTPMAASIASGSIVEPDPDVAAEMYEASEEVLGAAGYLHYEISNWSKPGRECLHNLNYWRNGDYIGAGAGAHSHIGGFRLCNYLQPLKYVTTVEKGLSGNLNANGIRGDEVPQRRSSVPRPPRSRVSASDRAIEELSRRGLAVESAEEIDEKTAMAETMMLGLRLDEGVNGDDFSARFGRRLGEIYGHQIEELKGTGLLTAEDSVIRLTARGRLLGNQVFCRFV